MHVAFAVVRFLSVATLGIFAGAMLTEAGLLVPFWRSLEPAEFLAWYRANDQRLIDFFAPLTTVTVLLAVAAGAVSIWEGHPGRWLSALAAALALATLASFFVYFRAANLSFATGTVGVTNVATELARWATWHWWRTGVSCVAFAAALLALCRTR